MRDWQRAGEVRVVVPVDGVDFYRRFCGTVGRGSSRLEVGFDDSAGNTEVEVRCGVGGFGEGPGACEAVLVVAVVFVAGHAAGEEDGCVWTVVEVFGEGVPVAFEPE